MRARRIPLSHGSHVTGWHPVRLGHGMVQFESALERDCIAFLAGHPGFLRIRSQPTTITFVHAGRARRYTPDFLVDFASVPDVLAALGFASQTYVEVKYAEQTASDRDLITARLELRASHNCGTKCHVPSLEEGVETAETPGDGFRAGWLVAA